MDGRLVVVAGTRPELVKIWSVLRSLDERGVEYFLLWTGQHYDYEMSRIFFEQLGLRDPDAVLGEDVARASALPDKLGVLIGRLGAALEGAGSHVYALGDTVSVAATAIAANLAGKPFLHDEAGVRSFDLGMPEEVNRKIADSIAAAAFTPTLLSYANLVLEGVHPGSIFLVGSTAVDAVLRAAGEARKTVDNVLAEHGLEKGNYILLTMHRRENIYQSPRLLAEVFRALSRVASSRDAKILFPVHPHTRKRLGETGLLRVLEEDSAYRLVRPMGYIEFIAAMTAASLVATDSGGIQVEAPALGTPTLTLRDTTEWPETVVVGANRLVGLDPARIREAAEKLLETPRGEEYREIVVEIYGQGRAGHRIARAITVILEKGVERKRLQVPMDEPYMAPIVVEEEKQVYNRLLCYTTEGLPLPPGMRKNCQLVLGRGLVGADRKRLAEYLRPDWSRVEKHLETGTW